MINNLGETNKTSLDLMAIADRFTLNGKVTDVRQYGSGNINSTFLVILEVQPPFILQRINTRVFCQPELVMNNMCVLSNYVSQRLEKSDLSATDRRWLIPQVLSTSQKQNYWIAEDKSFWRAISFIDNSQSFDTIQDIQHPFFFQKPISCLFFTELSSSLKHPSRLIGPLDIPSFI